MSRRTEESSVQNPLVRYAQEAGWTYLPASEAAGLRRGEGGLLFYRILEEKLKELNPGFVTEANVAEVIQKIESVTNTIEGNGEILKWLRGEQSIYDEHEQRQRNVTVVDFGGASEFSSESSDSWSKNVFQVTDEWQYTNGQYTHRADVMFLVNGIPVAVVEAKSATKTKGIEEGLTQIRQYHQNTPEMMTMPQVFDVTQLLEFYYGATWNLDRKNLFKWKETSKGDRSFEHGVKSFFDRRRFLTMLKEWILFFYRDDELQKTVLRQHQTRSVVRILKRCGEKRKNRGLIWHTQGSGKTFTMISAARLLLTQWQSPGLSHKPHKSDNKGTGKPTVILMIDRNELEGQLAGWVDRLLGEMSTQDVSIAHASNKRKLKELLSSDFRGLIISMIHKFDEIPKDINTRSNIFVLVDEAHRTTGGDLGNYLVAALPNATMIGFTGTPIDKTAHGKGTFKVFGKHDQEGYLDKYSIAESIEDGTTLPLRYSLAPNEIRVPREQLEEEFLNLAQAEGISDVDDLNTILDHAMRLKTFLKADDRIDKVAAFVADHFRNNVEPLGYKAFLVAVDREACALYKEALDKVLPTEYSEPIYTASQHDSQKYPLVHKHQVSRERENKARRMFSRADAQPKIFIVTDKLLTGFDAPVLYCMYLDKPMRDHVLLQAIARVNRPYESNSETRKPCGLVVDFVGIFEKLEKALAFDSDVVSGVIEDLDLLLRKFKELMNSSAAKYIKLCSEPMDDKAVEAAIEAFSDKEKREDFYSLYKELEMLYEILSPSPDLRDYVRDFGCLSLLYQIVRNAFRKKTYLYGDVAKKTEKLVRERAETYGLDMTSSAAKIDESTLKAIRQSGRSEKARIINLVNRVRQTVAQDADQKPYLRAIGERAEQIMEDYDNRQETTREALKKVEQLVLEIVDAEKQKENMGFDETSFAFFWTLKDEGVSSPEKTSGIIRTIFDRFPHHRDNAEEMRQLKAELYKTLLPQVGKKRMVAVAEQLLRVETE